MIGENTYLVGKVLRTMDVPSGHHKAVLHLDVELKEVWVRVGSPLNGIDIEVTGKLEPDQLSELRDQWLETIIEAEARQ